MKTIVRQAQDLEQRRKVAVVTGSRSEYALLKPLMTGISNHSGLELQLVVAGMHLSDAFGHTVDEITADGFTVDARVEMTPAGDAASDMADAVGRGIMEFSAEFKCLRPDVVLVLGDRTEAFAAAVAAALSGCVLAHIHGGDRSRGGFDESMRHAITKLAHLHFAASEISRQRIIKMGERPEFVWNTGAPGVDVVKAMRKLSREELSRELGFQLQPKFVLCIQHPVSTEADQAAEQMRITLEALEQLAEQTVLVYPNSDAGGRRMIAVIEERCDRPELHVFKSLPSQVYVNLLASASGLVGNSSSGIIEAPALKVPVVNIGIRQAGRERAENVIDTDHDVGRIVAALRRAMTDEEFRRRVADSRNPYGDGGAAERIVEHLHALTIDATLLSKQIAY